MWSYRLNGLRRSCQHAAHAAAIQAQQRTASDCISTCAPSRLCEYMSLYKIPAYNSDTFSKGCGAEYEPTL